MSREDRVSCCRDVLRIDHFPRFIGLRLAETGRDVESRHVTVDPLEFRLLDSLDQFLGARKTEKLRSAER